MFLRLYDDPDVSSYLADGAPKKAKCYLNSLGSLDIMEAVSNLLFLVDIFVSLHVRGNGICLTDVDIQVLMKAPQCKTASTNSFMRII